MKVFLAGAGGFIGSALRKHLEGMGISVILHRGTSQGDVRVPEGVDAVVNTAGRLGGGCASREEMFQSNAVLPERLGRECLTRGIPLVHVSTPGVCGLLPDVREDAPLAPEGDYEETKAEGERLLERLDLPFPLLTVLRPDFVFGPGDRHKLPFFRQAARGWFPLVGLRGARTRPTHVQDVCRAVEASLPGGILAGGLFHVGGPEVLTLKAMVRETGTSLGRGVLTVPVPRWVFRASLRLGPLCPGALSESRLRLFGTDRYVSIRKAAEAGFNPAHTYEEAARDAAAWYRREGLL